MSSPPALQPTNSSSSSPFQNLKPSILVILLILSITFLLSLSLCLLLRHLNRRCLRHLSSSSSSATAPIPASTTRVSPESLPLSVTDSLPMFTFSSIKRSSSADCAVCLSKFEAQDQLRLLPLCCHAFHVHCIDTWLRSNQSCPLCRSPIQASDSDLFAAAESSFRLEIGSISHRQTAPDGPRSSYSVGSFEYVVDEESEINTSETHRRSVADKETEAQWMQDSSNSNSNLPSQPSVSGRTWLKDYVDRLSASISSRASSFRASGRFFTGSSRRSEIASPSDYDVEGSRVGEEISEMFRWFSGV